MATTQDDAPDDVRLHQSHRVLSQAYKADSLRHQGSATRITTDDVKEGLKAAEQNRSGDSQAGAEMQVTKKRTESLGFLDLPGEIRNKIYRLALVKDPGPSGCDHLISNLTPPALALANKQVAAESLPIYYGENFFYLLLSGGWFPWRARVQTTSHFRRFSRLLEYFERHATSSTDQSPLRYIKNIVVHVDLTYLHRRILEEYWGSLCIRSEQQRIAYTYDSEAAEGGSLDPTPYEWTIEDVASLKTRHIGALTNAHRLLKKSFSGCTQPISMAVLSRIRLLEDNLEQELRLDAGCELGQDVFFDQEDFPE